MESYATLQGFHYQEIPILRKVSIVQDLSSVWKIARYIINNQINIVNGHTPKGGLLAMVAAFCVGVPVRIYFRHGLVYETSRGLKRFMLKTMDRLASLLATKIVCVSPSVFKRSLEDHLSPRRKQIILAHGTCNGINVKRFDKTLLNEKKRQELMDKYHISEETFVIGFTGRLVCDKGIVELVKAFQLIKIQYSNVKLLLVGMMEDRDALPEDIISVINNDASIIYTGYVDNQNIEYYYSIMNLFVLPSYREGFPTSILEASAMSLPVITTKVTGCVDAIKSEETGVFVGFGVMELERAISSFVESPIKCKSFGLNGRTFVEENFEENIVWKEIEKLYK